MFTIKEIDFGWFIFVGLVLLGVALLEVGLLRGKVKQVLAPLLVMASAAGVFLLLFTSVGASYPLRDVLARKTPMNARVEQGMEIYFKYGCPNCHQIDGWGTPAAPDMGGIVERRGERWVREYLVNSDFRGVSSAMPEYSSLREEELARLLEFMVAASGPPE